MCWMTLTVIICFADAWIGLQLEVPPEIPDDTVLHSIVTMTSAPSFEPSLPWPVQVHRAGVILRDDVDPYHFLAPDAPSKEELIEKEVGWHTSFSVSGVALSVLSKLSSPSCVIAVVWIFTASYRSRGLACWLCL